MPKPILLAPLAIAQMVCRLTPQYPVGPATIRLAVMAGRLDVAAEGRSILVTPKEVERYALERAAMKDGERDRRKPRPTGPKRPRGQPRTHPLKQPRLPGETR